MRESTDQQARVVTLAPTLSAEERAALEQLPSPIIGLHQKGRMVLEALSSRCIDATLDTLFAAAQQSEVLTEQRALFSEYNQFLRTGHRLQCAWLHNLDVQFAALGQPFDIPTREAPCQWQVQLTEYTNIALAQATTSLASIGTRMASLMKSGDELPKLHNPLAPDAIAYAFEEAALELGGNETTLNLLVSQLEQTLLSQWIGVLEAMDNILDAYGVASAKSIDSHFAGKHVSQLSAKRKVPPAKVDAATVSLLSSLFGNSKAQQKFTNKDLIKVLNVAQRELGEATAIPNYTTLIQQLRHTQKRLDIKGEFSAYQEELIKLVNVSFEAATRNSSLDTLTQTYINRLIVPVIKTALIDKRFFTTAHHPARELIDTLVRLGIGWQQKNDPQKSARSIRLIERVTRDLTELFGHDTVLFSKTLEQIEKEQRQYAAPLSLLATRIKGNAPAKAKLGDYEKQARKAIEQRLQALDAPSVVTAFAERLWGGVLVQCAQRQGLQSQAWQSHCATLSEICALAKPCKSPQEKAQRVKQLPELNQKIQRALLGSAFCAFEMDEIIKGLHQVFTECLQGQKAREIDLQQDHSHEAPTPGNVEGAPVASSEQTAEAAPAPHANLSDEDQALGAEIQSYSRGALFNWTDDDKPSVRCQLAAIIKQTERYIFTNRNGIKMLDLSLSELIDAHKTGKIKPLDHGNAADHALQRVVTGLRRNPSGPTASP